MAYEQFLIGFGGRRRRLAGASRPRTLLIWLGLLLLTASLVSPGTAEAAVIPKATDKFYVNDYADVLTEKTENTLTHYALLLHRETEAQVVLVTVDTTNGTPINEYATQLFNDWGIGSAAKNNGLLLLLAIGDDDYWAIQGKGIEGTVTNEKLAAVLQTDLEPDFATGTYSRGAVKTYASLLRLLGGTFGETGNAATAKTYVSDNAGVISQAARDYINAESNRLRLSTGSSVYIVTVNDKKGQSLQDYTYAKFNGIGAGPRDVMITLDIAGDDYHALQGKDVDGLLTNDRLGAMLDSALEPKFAAKDFAGGAASVATELYGFFLARPEYLQKQAAAAASSATAETASGDAAQAAAAEAAKKTDQGSAGQSSDDGPGWLVLLPLVPLVLVWRSVRKRRRYMHSYGVPYNPHSWRNRSRRHYNGYHSYGSGPSYGSGGNQPDRSYTNSGGGGSAGGGTGRSSRYEASDEYTSSGSGGYSSGGGAGRSSWSGGHTSSGGGGSTSGSGASSGGAGRSSGSSGHTSGGGGGSTSGDSSGGGNASSGGGAGRRR